MKTLLLIVLGLIALFFVCLYFGQGQLIYFPRRYYQTYNEVLSQVDQVHYQVDGKKQIAFLLKRESDDPPEKVWWLFGGNGALALDWVTLIEKVAPEHPDTAFVLVDYPGYGFSKGSPKPDRIFRSVDQLYEKLSKKWGFKEQELAAKSSTLGHSLGAAVAFDTAGRYPFSRIVAISPFTTMKAMAKRQMGGLMASMLSHLYDNESSLDQILARQDRPEITILHGDKDYLIPISMSRELVERSSEPGRIKLIVIPGAGHNDIIFSAESQLLELLRAE